ncbi:MAG TPA: hypothetical protein VNA69_19310 [Thermoanaerobaculia bacterium]|nr:hypothetical protein [Thermoanaerobaculia bacterium]
MKVKIECKIGGIIAGLGMGFTGPSGVKPMACACKEKDLLGSSGGWTSWIGPYSIDSSPCKTKGGTANSVSISKAWGGGFGGTWCTTKKVE